jgi:hypothetical protein
MSECLSMEAIARPGGLSAGERAHVAACARCEVRVAQYREFVAGRVDVPAADLADAEARLGAFLDQRLGIAASARTVRAAAKISAWDRLAEWFGGPGGRLVVGVAAVAIVAGTFVTLRAPQRAPVVERGGAASSMVLEVRTDPAAAGVALSWGAHPGADRYVVEIISAELEPLASFGPLTTPAFTLARGAVVSRASGTIVYCRVAAKHGSVTLAESELATLRLP